MQIKWWGGGILKGCIVFENANLDGSLMGQELRGQLLDSDHQENQVENTKVGHAHFLYPSTLCETSDGRTTIAHLFNQPVGNRTS